MRISRPHLIVALLSGLALSAMPLAARATLPPADISYVIVTSDELATAFEPLAALKTSLGLPTRVVTLDWITGNVAPGVDQPATIRAFLQEAHAQWGTRYVLLGGTVDVVPTRWVANTFYPPGSSTIIAADLYYAGLSGTWDGDGDGIFGEPAVNAENPGDGADLQPDLAFGRAPVATAEEAANFVMKNIAFQIQSEPGISGRALLAADVIFPMNYPQDGYIVLDGATHAEAVRTILQAATPAWQVVRHYENLSPYPGALPATALAFMAALNSGDFRLVQHFAPSIRDQLGIGSTMIPGVEFEQLTNTAPFFFALESADCGAHDTPSVLRSSLIAPEGGAAGGIGFTRASFPSAVSRYFGEFFRQATASRETTVGDALAATLTAFIAPTATNYVDRWTHLTIALLADPTAPLLPIDMSVGIEDIVDDGQPAVPSPKMHLTAAPNPFNPQVEIRAEIADSGSARLSICDVRGREVRTLFDGVLQPGESRWQWDGCDAAGRASASGVYLLRLETDQRVLQRSITLAR